ncbi:hypothetical protein EV175_006504, partial [Coemansia sp. RSA 1933]
MSNESKAAAQEATDCGIVKTADLGPSNDALRLKDHQNRTIPGTSIKTDTAFYRASAIVNISSVYAMLEVKLDSYTNDLPDKHFGQLADYAQHVWASQPTRTFVPVFFLHGQLLTLFLFNRAGYERIEIGPICYELDDLDEYDITAMQTRLKQIWFLLALPPSKFGHFYDAWKKPKYLAFKETEGVRYTAEEVSPLSDDAIVLSSRIERTVSIRGRLAYLLTATYRKQNVVLKLSWTPVGRMPEGAVYEILRKQGVPSIPNVFQCGILIPDCFGYRLEFLVLEDCGKPIAEYVNGQYGGNKPKADMDMRLLVIISQVSHCLASAYAAGVLHRDISAGNITIAKGGNARVIDWGYAKFFDSGDNETNRLIGETCTAWGLERDSIIDTETSVDMITGTSLYMAIQ